MRQAPAPSPGKPSGLARVCRVWGLARSIVSWQRPERAKPAARRGPLGPCADDELGDHSRRLLEASPCPGAGSRKVWARVRQSGIRTSPRRVLRLLRAHQLLAPTRRGQPHGPQAHEGTIIPAQVDPLWGTDRTATYTRADGQGAIFLAVDHGSAEWVGIHAATHGTRCEALEPIRHGVCTPLGTFTPDIAQGLRLRQAHGSQYLAQVFQEELTFGGITSAPACVRDPEGNGGAERFMRTLQEHL